MITTIMMIIFKVLDINGTSVLLTTDLAEDKTYMKWCNYWDQVAKTKTKQIKKIKKKTDDDYDFD